MLQVVGSNPIARSENCEEPGNQKALALPESPVPVPAQPAVRVLDLLRAIDAAAVEGELFAVRALTAAAVHHIAQETSEAERAGDTPSTEGGDS
jgi:hypothetical protein